MAAGTGVANCQQQQEHISHRSNKKLFAAELSMENYEVQEPRAAGVGVGEGREESLDSGDESHENVEEPFPDGDALFQSVIHDVTRVEPTIDISADSPIRQLNDDQLGRVVGAVKDKKHIGISSWPAAPNAEAARKAAVVASRMSGLHHLSLRCIPYAEPERGSFQNAFDIVLESVARSPNIRLRHLSIHCLEGRPEAWRRFADRFATSIKTLDVSIDHPNAGMMSSEIAQSVRSGFAALEELSLFVGKHGEAASVRHLLRAASHSPIKALHVSYDESECAVTQEVAVAALCDSLQTLSVWANGSQEHDASMLLVNALRSESLEELCLVSLSLSNASCQSLQRMQPHAANFTMKKVRLVQCQVGEQCMSLLGCFKGLVSMDIGDIVFETFPSMPTGILAGLGSLVNISSYGSGENGDNETLVWLASNLMAASAPPNVRIHRTLVIDEDEDEDNVDPTLPGLSDVIVHSGTLSLQLSDVAGNSNVPFICQGIESAISLSRLTVILLDVDETRYAARILDALARCPSLRRFDGYFRAHNDANDIGPDIEAFLSRNSTLEHFGFEIRVELDDEFAGEIDDDFDEYSSLLRSALVFAVKGLRSNRRLETLRLYVHENDDGWTGNFELSAGLGEQIVAMLEECNTSLKRIEGVVEYESPQQEERISHLLGLNRHGQNFVANARCVPMDVWGDVLMRISSADCNYFVTELARRALNEDDGTHSQQTKTGKRR